MACPDPISPTLPRTRLRQWRLDSGRLSFLRNLVIFELAFFIAYKTAMLLAPRAGSPFWLPDSVLLCALMLSRRRTWWIYVVAPLPLRLLVAVTPDAPTWFLLVAFLNDSLKALVAAAFLRRVLHGRSLRFDSLGDFWTYLAAAAVAAPALSGLVGAASWRGLGHEFWPTWRDWFLGDALANIVLTPLLLCVAADWRKLATANPLRYLEGFTVFSGVALAVRGASTQGLNDLSLVDLYDYIVVVLLLLSAYRFGPVGASGSLTIMSLFSVLTSSAMHATSATYAATGSVVYMQLFLIVIGIPIMSLSVLLEQQRKTQHSLLESEVRFRNIADTAPVLIWIFGPDKRATFFNKAWLEFTGRTMEQGLADGWAQGVHPNDLDRCLATYSSSFDARRGFQMEYRLRRADGEHRWVLDKGIPRYHEGEFAGFIGSCLDVTEQKQIEERLRAGQQQLQTLAGNLLTAQEDERRRLSRELHDDVTQELASLSIELGRLATEIPNSLENTRAQVQAMQDRTIQLSAEVRRLAYGLHPSVIEDLGLSIALKEFCHQLGIAKAINVHYQGLVEDRSFDKTTATCLYRVAQESLRNSTIHGHATEVHVELTAEAASIHLRVRDNGTGFSIEDARTNTGLGLISMQERIRFVGGTLTVSSQPGKGTEISASVPAAGVGSASRANAAG
jgi:PAS domain S-box-containing protein